MSFMLRIRGDNNALEEFVLRIKIVRIYLTMFPLTIRYDCRKFYIMSTLS